MNEKYKENFPTYSHGLQDSSECSSSYFFPHGESLLWELYAGVVGKKINLNMGITVVWRWWSWRPLNLILEKRTAEVNRLRVTIHEEIKFCSGQHFLGSLQGGVW